MSLRESQFQSSHGNASSGLVAGGSVRANWGCGEWGSVVSELGLGQKKWAKWRIGRVQAAIQGACLACWAMLCAGSMQNRWLCIFAELKLLR
jgi:hypothetical protein